MLFVIADLLDLIVDLFDLTVDREDIGVWNSEKSSSSMDPSFLFVDLLNFIDVIGVRNAEKSRSVVVAGVVLVVARSSDKFPP